MIKEVCFRQNYYNSEEPYGLSLNTRLLERWAFSRSTLASCKVVFDDVIFSYSNEIRNVAEYVRLNGYLDNYLRPAFSFLDYDKALWQVISNIDTVSSKSQRIKDINESLRKLRRKLKKRFNFSLLQEIRSLVAELYNLISFHYNQQRKYVKRLRVKLFGGVIRDIRNVYRHTVQTIFKNLPDFSGCEEEFVFTKPMKCKQHFQTQLVKQCIKRGFYWIPWMLLSNRPSINYPGLSWNY